MIYIKVEHPQGLSEATGYTANITSGPTWSMDHVYINATLTFNWTTGYSAHPVAIEWFASPPSVTNSITWQNGSATTVTGDWRTATATMTIAGQGPHPGRYISDWAVVGTTSPVATITPTTPTPTPILNFIHT